MSKGSLFWGNARGRLGQSVFYRSGGEQRNRTYVAKIKNPRTRAQMKNRLSMSNFANIFRAYQPILQESFIGRPIKESGFNAFTKANKSASSAILIAEGKDLGLGVPLFMQVSKGTITNHGVFGAHQFVNGTSKENYIGYKIDAVGTEREQYNQAAIAKILGSQKKAVISTTEAVNYLFQAFGLPTDAVISVLWARYADVGFEMGINSYSLSQISVSNSEFALHLMDSNSDSYGIGANLGTMATDEYQCAVVISYKVNGKLNCTSARITSVGDNKAFSKIFMEGGETYEEELAQFSTGSALVGGGSYISVGGENNPSGGGSGSGNNSQGGGNNQGGSGDSSERISISTSVNDNSMGSVTGAGTYSKGEHVTLIAMANDGYRFVCWGDEVTDNPRTIIANLNGVTYSAIFEAE